MAPTPSPTATALSEPSSTLSDRVAPAAMIIGGAAFIIAVLHMLQAYLTSELRHKCSRGAIGARHKFTKVQFCTGYINVYYPRVKLNCQVILTQRFRDGVDRQKSLPNFQLLRADGEHGWADVANVREEYLPLGFFDVFYGSDVFQKGRKPVKVYKLGFAALLNWYWYLWKNPRYTPRTVRASWANILTCLDVRPHKELCERELELADVIPSGIDHPIQTTTLSNIGIMCFVLGMEVTKCDRITGTIYARNEYATLETLETGSPGMPKVVTLQGDIIGLRGLVTLPTALELLEVAARANGLVHSVRGHTSAGHSSNSLGHE